MSGLVSSDESKRLEYFSLARVIDDFQEEQCGVFSESRRESVADRLACGTRWQCDSLCLQFWVMCGDTGYWPDLVQGSLPDGHYEFLQIVVCMVCCVRKDVGSVVKIFSFELHCSRARCSTNFMCLSE